MLETLVLFCNVVKYLYSFIAMLIFVNLLIKYLPRRKKKSNTSLLHTDIQNIKSKESANIVERDCLYGNGKRMLVLFFKLG